MKRVIVGALLVLGVLGSLAFGTATVSAATEPEQCLQTDHPEIERLRDTYHWLEEADGRATVIMNLLYPQRDTIATAELTDGNHHRGSTQKPTT